MSDHYRLIKVIILIMAVATGIVLFSEANKINAPFVGLAVGGFVVLGAVVLTVRRVSETDEKAPLPLENPVLWSDVSGESIIEGRYSYEKPAKTTELIQDGERVRKLV